MDNLFGTPLFSNQNPEDVVSAFNYLHYTKINKHLDIHDLKDFSDEINIDNGISTLVNLANIKLVNNNTALFISRYLKKYLELSGLKHGFVVFNPEVLMDLYNPFMNSISNKLIEYVTKDTYMLPSTWIYFEGIAGSKLEQNIKLIYSEYCTEDGNKLYVRLTPQGDYKFILNFIDDVFRYS